MKAKYELHQPEGYTMFAIFDSEDQLVMLLPLWTPLTVVQKYVEEVQND
jgi:hypothetical protein